MAILMMIGVGCLLLLLIGVAGILVALSLTIRTPGTLAITGATAASVSRLAKSSRPPVADRKQLKGFQRSPAE
ncbi:hypothetical protein [Nocardia gipuzkoensis]|uniref:hypothetical protein n=1 Tax=Nocardia gipuzkoensis TaxID=2749991 RepID=UPI00237EE46C|nr:hypothetical protein [Nocardia gipuzkoensis]MDE1674968.1 hypothetical protein [Nocardia gipuzkoensis]